MGENGDVVYGSGFDFDQPDVSPAIGTGKKKFPKRSSLDEEDFINLLHGSDPVKIELNRLQNELKGIYFFFCLLFQIVGPCHHHHHHLLIPTTIVLLFSLMICVVVLSICSGFNSLYFCCCCCYIWGFGDIGM